MTADDLLKFLRALIRLIREKRVEALLSMAIVGIWPALVWLFQQRSNPEIPYSHTAPWLLGAVDAVLLVWLGLRVARQAIPPAPPATGPMPSAVRGLSAFSFDDGELFWKLGRDREIRSLLGLILDDQIPLVVIRGRSGAGKTSLLRAGVQYSLKQQKVSCVYWEARATKPVEGIRHAMSSELRAELPSDLNSFQPLPSSPVVVLIDQLEQLKQEIADHKPVFDLLKEVLRRPAPHSLKILVAFSEQYDTRWLDFEEDAQTVARKFPVKLFHPDEAADVMATLLSEAKLTVDRALLSKYAHSVADSSGVVSPVDIGIGVLVLANWAQQSHRERLSIEDYTTAGGASGVLAAHVQDRLGDVREADRPLLVKGITLSLIDLAQDQRVPDGATCEEIARQAGMNSGRLALYVTKYLATAHARILEPLDDTDVALAVRYRLAHNRLVPVFRQLAGEVLAVADRAKLIFDDHYVRWLRTQSPRYLLGGPDLRIALTHRSLLIGADQSVDRAAFLTRSRRHRNLRRYVAVGATSLMLTILISGWWFLHKQRVYDKTQMEANRLFSTIGVDSADRLTSSELIALWDLARSSADVRLAVLREAFASPENALRFDRRSSNLVHALLGLNPAFRAVVLRDVVRPRCYEMSMEGQGEEKYTYVCSSLILELDDGSVDALRFFLKALDHTWDLQQFESHGVTPSRLAHLVIKDPTGESCRLLLEATKKQQYFDRFRFLAESLGSLGGGLTKDTAEGAASAIIAAMKNTDDRDAIADLGSGLGALQNALKPETAEEGARVILAVMSKSTNNYEIANLGLALGLLQENLKPETAEAGARIVFQAMLKTSASIELQQLVRSIGLLEQKLKTVTIDEAAQRILRIMKVATAAKGETPRSPDIEAAELAKSLVLLTKKLRPQTADRGAELILAAMEMKESAYMAGVWEAGSSQIGLGSYLANTLGSLSVAQSAPGVESIARRILADIQSRTEDRKLNYLAEAFVAICGRLTTQGARTLFSDVTAAIDRSTQIEQLSYLAQSLGALGMRLDSDSVAKASVKLLEVMQKRTDKYELQTKADASQPSKPGEQTQERLSRLNRAEEGKRIYLKQMSRLAMSLGTVANKLNKDKPGAGVELITTAMAKTKDYFVMVYLGSSLASIADGLDTNSTDHVSGLILTEMGKVANDPDLSELMEHLADGLSLLCGMMKQETAQQAETSILAIMDQGPGRGLKSLARALGSLGERVQQASVERGLQRLLDSIRNDTDPDCSAAVPLVRKDTIPIIIDLLKWPNCSSAHRDLLVTKIGEVEGQTFVMSTNGQTNQPDSSQFINWAVQHGFDVASPPANL